MDQNVSLKSKLGDVIRVKAVDWDAPGTANSKVIYSIESGNKDKFSIDSASGVVRINENTNLDRDLYGSFYTLKIAATDFGSINTSPSPSSSSSSLLSLSSNISTYQTLTTTKSNRLVNETTTKDLISNASSSSSSSLNGRSGGGESFCFVTIKVLDVNNKSPKFMPYPE